MSELKTKHYDPPIKADCCNEQTSTLYYLQEEIKLCGYCFLQMLKEEKYQLIRPYTITGEQK